MVRAGAAFLLGLGFILLEAFIVMEIKNYDTVKLGTNGQFITVWLINSLLAFAILTDIKNWLTKHEKTEFQHDL